MSNASSTSDESRSWRSPSFWGDKQTQTWLWIAGLSVVLIASYWNSLRAMSGEWQRPEYSHGYLIPLFAAVLMWMRHEPFADRVPPWHRWCGVALMCLGIAIRVLATRWVLFTVDYVSFIPSLLGVFVIVGGLRALKWAGLPILFLVFMYPLPRIVTDRVHRPLQDLATRTSVYAMQTLGVEVYRDGNRIHLEQMDMNVEEQCSGLRMLTIFLALAVALAMIVTHRPWWERLVIVFSAVPVALLVNVIRITITGLLYNLNVRHDIADRFFHDFAGWIMMPMALGFLWLELYLLSRLFLEVEPGNVRAVGFAPARADLSQISGQPRGVPKGPPPIQQHPKS